MKNDATIFCPHCMYLLWLFFFAQTIIKLCYVGEGFLCNSPFSIRYPGGLSIFIWWDLSWKLEMKSRKLVKNEIKANGLKLCISESIGNSRKWWKLRENKIGKKIKIGERKPWKNENRRKKTVKKMKISNLDYWTFF